MLYHVIGWDGQFPSEILDLERRGVKRIYGVHPWYTGYRTKKEGRDLLLSSVPPLPNRFAKSTDHIPRNADTIMVDAEPWITQWLDGQWRARMPFARDWFEWYYATLNAVVRERWPRTTVGYFGFPTASVRFSDKQSGVPHPQVWTGIAQHADVLMPQSYSSRIGDADTLPESMIDRQIDRTHNLLNSVKRETGDSQPVIAVLSHRIVNSGKVIDGDVLVRWADRWWDNGHSVMLWAGSASDEVVHALDLLQRKVL